MRFNGKELNGKSFDKWLSNTKYYGHFTYAHRENDNIYPPIIDKATFDKAQERMKHNRHFTRTNHTREKYLLTGKIFCGYCGTLLTADGTNKKNGTMYRWYGCKTARHGKCEKRLEPKEKIEQRVIECVQAFMSNKNFVTDMAEYLAKHYEQQTDENAVKAIDTRIQHTESQIETTTNAFIQAVAMQNDILKQNCDKKIKELQILIDDLKKQRTQLLFEQGRKPSKQDMLDFIEYSLDRTTYESDQEYYQQICDYLIKAVYVRDEKMIVWFIFDGKKGELPTQDEITDYMNNRTNSQQVVNGSAPNTFGRGDRIRTCVPFQANGFQDRPVVTASVPLFAHVVYHSCVAETSVV